MRFTLSVGLFTLAMSPLASSSKAFALGTITPHVTACARNEVFDGYTDISSSLGRKTTQRINPLQVRRGGALESAANINDIPDDDGVSPIWKKNNFQRRGMSVALAATYLTVMGAKCALPSVLSLLTSKNQGLTFPADANGVTTQSRMATLLSISTLAVALGKLLLGPVIDTLGGIRALQIALSLLLALLTTISCTQQFTLFAGCWILVDFVFSSCWAGCINAIHQSFPEESWGEQIGMLAIGARIGNTLSFGLFAAILHQLEQTVKQPWRQVFAVSAILQFIPLSLLTYFGGKALSTATISEIERSDDDAATAPLVTRPFFLKASLQTLRYEVTTPEFWLHLLSRSVLMVFASFLLFVPTLMSQVYGSSNAAAARGGSIYSLGCLLSVTLGSSRYSRLPKTKQALTSILLTGLATISSLLQLSHVTGTWILSSSASAATMFLWGFAFAIPFYIPPSLFALSRGGKQSSATIADVFDIGGFALLAIFNGYVASIDHANPADWIPTFYLTTACSLTSLVALPLAILRQ